MYVAAVVCVWFVPVSVCVYVAAVVCVWLVVRSCGCVGSACVCVNSDPGRRRHNVGGSNMQR